MFKILQKKAFREWTIFDCIVIGVLVVLSIMMRVIFWDLEFPDYTVCLKPWTMQLKEYGGFKGLAYEIGNYTPAYMHFLMIFSYFDIEPVYLIKALSTVFDVVLAIGFTLLLSKQLNKYQKVLAFFVVLWLPTVITNSAVWGQCDAIYVSFILLAFACALRDINLPICIKKKQICYLTTEDFVMLFLGMAFSFKLQTIFILPVLVTIYLQKEWKLRSLLWIPIVYCITLVPSWIAGRGAVNMLTIYLRQTGDYSELNLVFPNIYSFWQFEQLGERFSLFCILFCGMGLVFMVYWFYQHKCVIDGEWICLYLAVSVMFITYLLPHMHDRYAYLAEIVLLVYAMKNLQKLWIPIVANLIAIESYMRTLLWFSFPGADMVFALLRLFLIVIVGRDLVLKTKENMYKDR